jgi:hypothetical protein
MPLPRSPTRPLSRARLDANRPSRDRLLFRAGRKVRRHVAESAARLGLGPLARPTSVQVLMAFSRSGLDGDLPFSLVVQSAVLPCPLWYVSLPCPQLDTNFKPKRGSTTAADPAEDAVMGDRLTHGFGGNRHWVEMLGGSEGEVNALQRLGRYPSMPISER